MLIVLHVLLLQTLLKYTQFRSDLLSNLCFLDADTEDVCSSLGETLETSLDRGACCVHSVLLLSFLHVLLSFLDPCGIQQT